MRFAAKEDIAAPIDAVYAVLSDLEAFEKLALRKGVDLRRGEAGTEPGGRWDLRFRLRGRQRHVKVTLLALQPTSGMRFSGQSPNLDLTLAVSLIDLSRQRTRISVELEVLPRTLAARIVLQSARLSKARLTRRFHKRILQLARYVSDRLAAN